MFTKKVIMVICVIGLIINIVFSEEQQNVQELIKKLKSAKDIEYIELVKKLGETKDKSAIPALMEALELHKADVSTSTELVAALVKIKGEIESIPMLLELSERSELKGECLNILNGIKYTHSIDELSKLLKNGDSKTKEFVIETFEETMAKPAIDVLKDVSENDKDEKIREKAKEAIKKIQSFNEDFFYKIYPCPSGYYYETKPRPKIEIEVENNSIKFFQILSSYCNSPSDIKLNYTKRENNIIIEEIFSPKRGIAKCMCEFPILGKIFNLEKGKYKISFIYKIKILLSKEEQVLGEYEFEIK
jgi:hypothetical protein